MEVEDELEAGIENEDELEIGFDEDELETGIDDMLGMVDNRLGTDVRWVLDAEESLRALTSSRRGNTGPTELPPSGTNRPRYVPLSYSSRTK